MRSEVNRTQKTHGMELTYKEQLLDQKLQAAQKPKGAGRERIAGKTSQEPW